ncbi:hypothetical protein SPSYN_03018 [Sporotomaculum syntrophicum]|uniref:Uncharacterized protein n=1 Tax=Sporotomaculum syntrophicum TaxID=182264 RepID=A0A9D3AWJ4_9FIRM|nr:hypothetical protein [Sporotomaculum syntrophicum]KAF1083862.1 hypothetical protein SPSYN_03018 [Sporotomaculum syntrophicum]
MNKKDDIITMFNDMSAGQMKPFQLDKKDDLLKLVNRAKHVLIFISKDEGSLITDHVISNAHLEFNGNLLIVNDKIQIPINDESIEFVYQDKAEINYIDQDGFMTNIKLIIK